MLFLPLVLHLIENIHSLIPICLCLYGIDDYKWAWYNIQEVVKMNAVRCKKCFALYPADMQSCPSCGETNNEVSNNTKKSSRTTSCSNPQRYGTVPDSIMNELIKTAEKKPESALTCLKCGTKFPNGLSKCPRCGIQCTGGYFGKSALQQTVKINHQLTQCNCCNKEISIKAETCPHCGNPTGVHACPKCGSTNTKTISGASKAVSIYLWGPFAANKVVSKFQCKDCWHKF